MDEGMRFPDTVEEFMKQYKVVDREGIYMSKGSELVPIFRMDQWFEHEKAQLSQEDTTKDATFDLQPICNDAISRKSVKDLLIYNWDECCSACIGEVEKIPPVTQELLYRGAISLDKQEILQAGYEGREYDFYIGARLFSIREKAQ